VGLLSLIIPVLLATIVVGPQILMFLAVSPASWLIDDDDLRTRMMRVIAGRFGALTGIALLGLVITGLVQFNDPEMVPPSIQESMNDYRWGQIFMAKMALLVVLIGMIAFHGAVLGRRMRRVTEEVKAGRLERWELERARRNSLLFSALMILVSVAILALGVSLAYAPFADVAL
jgi:uncharacterized membrane protein